MHSFSSKIILSTLIIFSTFFSGCKSNDTDAEGKPIAKAYDNYLYLSDIIDILPENTSYADSEQIVNSAINNWLIEQIKLHKAEINLSSEKKDVDKELKEYRTSLLIYKYEQEYIKHKLITDVTPDEIQTYYDKYKSEFILKKNAILTSYVCIPKTAKNYSKFKYWFTSKYDKYIDKIVKYCENNASLYQTFDDDWIYFDKLLSMAEFNCKNQANFLKTRKYIEYSDDNKHYLAVIHDYRLKGAIAPLNVVKVKIKEIIINKRKLDLIHNLNKNSLRDAMKQNKVEIF